MVKLCPIGFAQMTTTKIPKILILFALTLHFASPVMCQTAEEIVDRYIAAIGGRASLEQIQTLKIVRDYEHVEEGRVERGTYYFMRPNFYRYEAGDGLVPKPA